MTKEQIKLTKEQIKFRDNCAIAALQGFLANPYLQKKFIKDIKKRERAVDRKHDLDEISIYMQSNANISFNFADAMLKEKLKRDKND